MRKRIAHLHIFHCLQHSGERLNDRFSRVYNPLNKLVRRFMKTMQRIRDLLFAIFMLLIAALIQAIIFLANPYYWPFVKELWSKLNPWAIGLVILVTIALICIIWWVIHSTLKLMGRMDKAKDEQQIAKMKEAFKQAL